MNGAMSGAFDASPHNLVGRVFKMSRTDPTLQPHLLGRDAKEPDLGVLSGVYVGKGMPLFEGNVTRRANLQNGEVAHTYRSSPASMLGELYDPDVRPGMLVLVLAYLLKHHLGHFPDLQQYRDIAAWQTSKTSDDALTTLLMKRLVTLDPDTLRLVHMLVGRVELDPANPAHPDEVTLDEVRQQYDANLSKAEPTPGALSDEGKVAMKYPPLYADLSKPQDRTLFIRTPWYLPGSSENFLPRAPQFVPLCSEVTTRYIEAMGRMGPNAQVAQHMSEIQQKENKHAANITTANLDLCDIEPGQVTSYLQGDRMQQNFLTRTQEEARASDEVNPWSGDAGKARAQALNQEVLPRIDQAVISRQPLEPTPLQPPPGSLFQPPSAQ